MTKIYYGRDLIGRFKCDGKPSLSFRIRSFLKKWIKIGATTCAIAWMCVGALKAGQHLFPEKVYAQGKVEVPIETDIPVLDRIIVCESGNRQFGTVAQEQG